MICKEVCVLSTFVRVLLSLTGSSSFNFCFVDLRNMTSDDVITSRASLVPTHSSTIQPRFSFPHLQPHFLPSSTSSGTLSYKTSLTTFHHLDLLILHWVPLVHKLKDRIETFRLNQGFILTGLVTRGTQCTFTPQCSHSSSKRLSLLLLLLSCCECFHGNEALVVVMVYLEECVELFYIIARLASSSSTHTDHLTAASGKHPAHMRTLMRTH